jgi:ATP-dependent Clp protease adaptor protein ClpS
MSPRRAAPVVEEERDVEVRLAPLYNVILLDDDDHTYDYVIEMLQKLFAFTEEKAYLHAVEVDTAKRTILLTCDLEHAEFKRDQIHAYGPDPRISRCKGSMSAVIEPAG